VDKINVTDIADQLAEDGEMETEAMRAVSFSLQVMRFEPGDPVHLRRGTDHQFTDFEGEFVVTVMYAPAEGSQAT
jgi:hypothetical protein